MFTGPGRTPLAYQAALLRTERRHAVIDEAHRTMNQARTAYLLDDHFPLARTVGHAMDALD
ncbi:MAG: hypothetical protein IPK81_14095 [Rhodospirillales bacterium]|nr:MAG: hypothetical protein IPK81_14095 [Rhodospirillales bacterium]